MEQIIPVGNEQFRQAQQGELIPASGRVSWGERKAVGNSTAKGWKNLSLECHMLTLFSSRATSVLDFLTAESLCSKTPSTTLKLEAIRSF